MRSSRLGLEDADPRLRCCCSLLRICLAGQAPTAGEINEVKCGEIRQDIDVWTNGSILLSTVTDTSPSRLDWEYTN